jgi:hypothetical protein
MTEEYLQFSFVIIIRNSRSAVVIVELLGPHRAPDDGPSSSILHTVFTDWCQSELSFLTSSRRKTKEEMSNRHHINKIKRPGTKQIGEWNEERTMGPPAASISIVGGSTLRPHSHRPQDGAGSPTFRMRMRLPPAAAALGALRSRRLPTKMRTKGVGPLPGTMTGTAPTALFSEDGASWMAEAGWAAASSSPSGRRITGTKSSASSMLLIQPSFITF